LPKNSINKFEVDQISAKDIQIADKGKKVKVIEVVDGELITNSITASLPRNEDYLLADPKMDILKLVVINRYKRGMQPQIGFIKGFNIKNAAMAGSVAHDSHNIIAVGDNDENIVEAVNSIIESKGGISFVNNHKVDIIPLPVAGLMANETIDKMATKYFNLEQKVKLNGSTLQAPFMTLAFMSLLVIPTLKLGDKGLFDVDKFEFTDIYVD
jgi:adenine deaminase